MKVYGRENCRAESEKTFFDWLAKTDTSRLKNNIDFAVASVRPENPRGSDVEVDFVLVGEAGILTIEVKGGIISIDTEGVWLQNGRKMKEDPFVQSMDNFYALMDYLLDNKIITTKNGYYACAFPSMAINEPLSKSYPSLLYLDKHFELAPENFIDGIFEYNYQKHGNRKLTQLEVQNIKKLLVPTYDYYIRDMATYSDDAIFKLSGEQIAAIEGLCDVKRLVIDGPPGSGKTVIAIEVLLQNQKRNIKTLFVCYNKALKNKVENDVFNRLDNSTKFIDVKTMEDVSKSTGKDIYDFVVLDETQDYLDIENFEHIDRILIDGLDNGSFRILLDEQQDVFNRIDADYLNGLVSKDTVATYHLINNYRNSENIINITKKLTKLNPGKLHANPKGLEVEINRIPYTGQAPNFPEYSKNISKTINSLLDQGFEPKDIMVLTVNSLGRSTLSESHIKSIRLKNGVKFAVPQNVDWSKDLSKQGILYGSPYILKGIDSKVVVCLDYYDQDKQKEALVCMTRARSKLILFVGKNIKI